MSLRHQNIISFWLFPMPSIPVAERQASISRGVWEWQKNVKAPSPSGHRLLCSHPARDYLNSGKQYLAEGSRSARSKRTRPRATPWPFLIKSDGPSSRKSPQTRKSGWHWPRAEPLETDSWHLSFCFFGSLWDLGLTLATVEGSLGLMEEEEDICTQEHGASWIM